MAGLAHCKALVNCRVWHFGNRIYAQSCRYSGQSEQVFLDFQRKQLVSSPDSLATRRISPNGPLGTENWPPTSHRNPATRTILVSGFVDFIPLERSTNGSIYLYTLRISMKHCIGELAFKGAKLLSSNSSLKSLATEIGKNSNRSPVAHFQVHIRPMATHQGSR